MKVERKKPVLKDVEDFIQAAGSPKSKTEEEIHKNLIVSIPLSYHKKLKQMALDEDTTVKLLVKESLTDFFSKRGVL